MTQSGYVQEYVEHDYPITPESVESDAPDLLDPSRRRKPTSANYGDMTILEKLRSMDSADIKEYLSSLFPSTQSPTQSSTQSPTLPVNEKSKSEVIKNG